MRESARVGMVQAQEKIVRARRLTPAMKLAAYAYRKFKYYFATARSGVHLPGATQ
jgi:hypothetical protein